jgi:NTP pyrophosphatase (non-canonical NTP hydrolase)
MTSGLQLWLREQAKRKGWERWHTPMRLTVALMSELGELAHLLRFAETPQHVPRERLEDEIADIGIFWFRLADSLGVDALEAVGRKANLNEGRASGSGVRVNSRAV